LSLKVVSGPETYQHRPQAFNQFDEKTGARELLTAEKVLFILDLVVERRRKKAWRLLNWKPVKNPSR
jgi:hypothetical protein